MISYKILYM